MATQPPPDHTEDTTKAVQQLLDMMQTRFQTLSESIIARIDDMGNRIDDLEKTIATMSKDKKDAKPAAEDGLNPGIQDEKKQ